MASFMDAAFPKLEGADLKALKDFVRDVKGSAVYVGSDLLDIEEVYGLADMREDLSPRDQSDDSSKIVKRALNRAIFDVAIEAGVEFLGADQRLPEPGTLAMIRRESRTERPVHRNYGTHYSNLLAYACLADYVDRVDSSKSAHRNHESSSVHPLFVQFNWDLALDRALYWLNASRSKADKNKGQVVGKNPLPWYGFHGTHDYRAGPLVARPHGAVNWIDSNDMKDCERDQTLRDDMIYPITAHSEIYIDRAPVIECDLTTRESVARDWMAIVPPTWRKQAHRPEFVAQWTTIQDALADLRRIVFIGYSLPRSDLYFRNFLALALARNDLSPRVYVWNRDLGLGSVARRNYLDLFAPLARQGRLFALEGSFGDPAFFDLDQALRMAKPLKGE
jgi:hypothetical protein